VARRKASAIVTAAENEAALEARLRNLARGATSYFTLEEKHAPSYGIEKAAYEAIVAAEDPNASPAARVTAREDLLAGMGRQDRALSHVRSMGLAQAGSARR
jgi:hypothetical protein